MNIRIPVSMFLTVAAAATALYAQVGPGARASTESIPSYEGAFLFSDLKAYRTGDLITVVVMENARAEKGISRRLTKRSGTDMTVNLSPYVQGVNGNPRFNANTAYDNGVSTQRKGTLFANVTVEVTEVLANGNLRIAGSQIINIDGERQTIRIAGVVRPGDISAGNTVLSSSIADARIEYSGRENRNTWVHWLGPVGWLYNWIF
jgi:flagellar L-ring protein precursor FlgH